MIPGSELVILGLCVAISIPREIAARVSTESRIPASGLQIRGSEVFDKVCSNIVRIRLPLE
jgi:hypothetical protein